MTPYYILTGLVAGIASGLFGIGGGIFVVIALTTFMKLPQHTANGISLVALLLPVGILGVFQYYRSGKINNQHIMSGFFIALGIIVGTYFGARLAVYLTAPVLKRAFAVFLILIGFRMLWRG